MTQLDDLINDLEDLLEEAKGANGVNGSSGPLTDPNKGYVSTRLTDSLANIQHALSAEHLDGAGTADMTGFPSTLPDVAEWCKDKATTAKGATTDAAKGSALKECKNGVNQDPGGFKDLAGIT